MSAMRSLRFAIYLRSTPQQVRAVLSDPALVPRWLAGTQFQTDAEEDPQRLSCEWLQTDHLDANGGSVSVVRFEFVAMGQVTRLTVIHRDLVSGGSFLKVVAAGWPRLPELCPGRRPRASGRRVRPAHGDLGPCQRQLDGGRPQFHFRWRPNQERKLRRGVVGTDA